MSKVKVHLDYINKMVANGGPEFNQWQEFRFWVDNVLQDIKQENITKNEVTILYNAFGESLSTKTMQGFSYCKPHGYSGDFEIITRIYDFYICKEPHLTKWDEFTQNLPAPKAVRNRKSYFKNFLKNKIQNHSNASTLNILNVASGPSRDVYELLQENPNANIHIDSIEMDINAIKISKILLSDYLDKVEFTNLNAFKFMPSKKYDLIWSAGLFDYFNDNIFIKLLKRYYESLKTDGGELVIGNFSTSDDSKNYMILLNWFLEYRSAEKLFELAILANVNKNLISVGKEEEGVNLFLHLQK